MTPRSYQEAIDTSPESRGMVPVYDEPEPYEPDYEDMHEQQLFLRYGHLIEEREWAGMEWTGATWQ